MSDEALTLQNACGCCEGESLQSPALLYNRPGLSAVAYRIGTHGEILASLWARLSSKDYPALAKLRSRDGDDFSIALLDAYACMANVLSFYQERLVNEAFLRTAGERFSLRELARLVGYRLRPGVAADTYLAFTLQEPPPKADTNEPPQASGVPEKVTLGKGIQVQSIPGPDEKPQIFETVEAVEARCALNRCRVFPKPSVSHVFGCDQTKGFLSPLQSESLSKKLASGDKLVLVIKTALGRIFFDPASNAITAGSLLVLESVRDTLLADQSLSNINVEGHTEASGDEPYDLALSETLAGSVRDWLVGQGIAADRLSVRGYGSSRPIADAGTPEEKMSNRRVEVVVDHGLEEKTVETCQRFEHLHELTWEPPVYAEFGGTVMYKWRRKFGLFGHNAPASYLFATLDANDHTKISWTLQTAITDYLKPVEPGTPLLLDNTYDIQVGAWVLILDSKFTEIRQIKAVAAKSATAGPLTATVSQITLNGELPRIADPRQVTVYELETMAAGAPRIAFWGLSFAPQITVGAAEMMVPLPHLDAVRGLDEKTLPPNRIVLLDDEASQPQLVKAGTPAPCDADGDGVDDHLRIPFSPALSRDLRTDSAVFYGNVALATHGETVHQILGSGAADKIHQRFALKHAPLTFIGAENETGAEATLEVRVNDILWQERSTLHQSGANDRAYVLSVDEDGAGTVQFGDGRRGTRLPTGQDTVRAIYRKGIGATGNLEAGQLCQLLTRPLGLKAVSNPLPADGGVDADRVDHVRRNIPLGVRTLGRVVSVQDYEDYARAYIGIAKAQAKVLNTRAGRTVFITVAGENGRHPPEATLIKLGNALKQDGNPLVHWELQPYHEATFRLALRIKRDPLYDRKKVLTTVEAALRAAFRYEARDFGQGVSRSEIIAVAQAVEGVWGVDLDRFYRGTAITLEDRLTPAAATVDEWGNAVAAELLLLDPGPLDYLEEMP